MTDQYDAVAHVYSAEYSPEGSGHVQPADGFRAVLIAIRSDSYPPVFFGGRSLQRMRVSLVPRLELPRLRTGGAPPAVPLRILPHSNLQGAGMVQGAGTVRAVRGEILGDSHGRLYEMNGNAVRALTDLVAGTGGEIFERVPESSYGAEGTLRGGDAHSGNDGRPDGAWIRPPLRPDGVRSPHSKESTSERSSKASSLPVGLRPIYPGRGARRILRWGEFKQVLGHRIANPERLRDDHRLLCNIQVFEACSGEALEAAGKALMSHSGGKVRLYALNEGMSLRLGLRGLAWGGPASPARGVTMEAVQDPTADFSGTAANGPLATPVTAYKASEIPERFRKPWEFVKGREESVYDMNSEAARQKGVLGWLRRIARKLFRVYEYRKWRALLSGKAPEEQLWSVRPPKGGISDLEVRNIVKDLLERAGYDSRTMLTEWEIFWRRKGA